MLVTSIVSAVSLLAAGASAHGAVTSYSIGGTTYPGYTGFSPATSPPTIQRQWPDYNPTLTVTDAKMRCNGGTSAALSATVPAGSQVTAIWAQWTHAQGPVMVWLFKCAGAFSSCTGDGQGWFKIDQMGMTAPPLTGTSWGTNEVMTKLKWTSTIPASLTPGNYLIRHELLALHQSNTPQFYAECAQLVITGSGTANPSSQYLAKIPGYAPQSDPGITIDIYSSTATTYTPPGPAVWKG
ncbi:family 61 putative glycoside hydrolase [Bisporella sp. PMI_857]|nr:family 61 putative glycoside hydrolase [Bisporella sp. PMI_857]